MAENQDYTIRVKRGTANEWAIYNPILGAGELGYDTTNKRLKVGDGLNVWSNVKFATGNSFDVARDAGFDGTLSEWLESLKGEDGVGPTNHITVGNVTTGPEPKVELRGESPNQIIDFTFPAAGEPIEYTKATPTKDGLMPKEDKATLDGASTFGKDFLTITSQAAARTAIGFSSGSLAELETGTSTVSNRVWSPKTIADYVNTKSSANLNSAKTYTDNAITNMPKDISKGVGAPTIPVVNNGVYIDTATGDQYIGVDRGPDPVINMATNPSFENSAPNFSMSQVSEMAGFKVCSLNLLYSNFEDSDTPEIQKWVNRKEKIAQYIQSNNIALFGCQENYVGYAQTQLDELFELLPSNYGMVQVVAANNGIIYDKNQFDLIEYDKNYYPINVLEATSGMERNLTVGLFRHRNSDQRLIYSVAHLTSGSEYENKRQESIVRITDYLNSYREKFSDLPGIILSTDTNKLSVVEGEDSFYAKMKSLGLEATKNKAASPVGTNQGSWHGFNVDGNSSGNWIDDNYSNAMLDVIDTKLDMFYANGTSLPLDANEFLSDHHPVLSTFKFRYNIGVSSNNATASVTTGSGAIAYYSSRWSNSGKVNEGSLAIRSTGSTGSSAYPALQGAGMERLRWEAGKTYTVSAWVHLEEKQINQAGYARAITIGITQNGSTQFSYARSSSAPNQAGTTRVSVTVTLPSDITNCFIRLMNGSENQTIYWDEMMITEGSTDHPFFSGDTLGCYWEGPRNGSRSIYPGPSWVKVN